MNIKTDKSIFKSFPELESERLFFRKMVAGDAKDLFLIRSNDDVMRFLDVSRFKSISDAEIMIGSIEESYQKESGINWGIVEKHSNVFLGYFGFFRLILCIGEKGICMKQ